MTAERKHNKLDVRVPKSDTKTQKPQPVVRLRIERGTTTPAARQNWKKWWAARIAEVKQSEVAK